MSAPEQVGALCGRLDLPLPTVCRMVSELCEAYGAELIVAEPATMRRTVLTSFAVASVEELAAKLTTAGAR